MANEDPRLRAYRRVLKILALVAGCGGAGVGVNFLLGGRFFHAFLAFCIVGFLVMVAHGYAAEERER